MSQHQETNPHFTWTPDSQPHEQRTQLRTSAEPQSLLQGRTWRPHRASRRRNEQQQPDQTRDLNFPHDDGTGTLPPSPQSLPQDQTRELGRPRRGQDEQRPRHNHESNFPIHDGLQGTWPKRQHRPAKQYRPPFQCRQTSPTEDQQRSPEGAPAQPPGQQLSPPPQRRGRRDHDQDDQQQYVRTPAPQKTKFITWCLAAFCAIFWVLVIVGGLIVLIVYLVFRPQIPRFDIPSATLNAAYLDMGYYLNADLTILANFTNPNRKVSVDFSSVIFEIYYGGIAVATHYIPPFSVPKATNMFANVEFISSQVRLPLKESRRLQQELESNQLVVFEVKGLFRARSNLGSFLRYSYWLYGHCSIATGVPPAGVMRGSNCRTKR